MRDAGVCQLWEFLQEESNAIEIKTNHSHQYLACFPESGPRYVVAHSRNQDCETLVGLQQYLPSALEDAFLTVSYSSNNIKCFLE